MTRCEIFLAVVLASAPGAHGGPPLQLSLKQAVEIALAPEGNTRVELATELIRQAEARSAQARAALLPNLDAYVTQQNQTRNLAAVGIKIETPVPGFNFPTLVGPFTTFDMRATASQTVFDFTSIRRFQAARSGIRAAESDSNGAMDQVAAAVAKAYLAAQAADARVQAAQANVELGEALVKLAGNQKAAGTGTGIEVTRSKSQLANQRQQLLVARNAQHQAQLQLLRTMGLDLDATLEFTDKLAYVPMEIPAEQEAASEALKARPDLKAQAQRELTASLSYSGTKLERLPSITAFADYGTIGNGVGSAIPTRTYGLSLRVPVFDGGRRDARRVESASQLRAEKLRTRDLREQIGLEARLAVDALKSAAEQVTVAEEGLALSEAEMAQAQRRYQAGVANSIEVTDAQARMERARENRIAALYNYNAARLDLGQAMGTIRKLIQ